LSGVLFGAVSGAFGDDNSLKGKPAEPLPEREKPRQNQRQIEQDEIPPGVGIELKKTLEEGRKSGKENMRLMTSDGTVLVTQVGEKGKIKISSENMAVITSLSENTITLVHNHPTGESFSGDDLAFLINP
jgi:hypothetical protein